MADQEVYASDDDLHYIEFWDVQTLYAVALAKIKAPPLFHVQSRLNTHPLRCH
jgi:hypothetical protein